MPEHNQGQMGGTMRLGKRRTLFRTTNSILSKMNIEYNNSKYAYILVFIY